MRSCSYVKVMKIANVYKIPDTAIPAVTTKAVLTILSAVVRNQSICEKTTFLDWSYLLNAEWMPAFSPKKKLSVSRNRV